MRHKSAWLTILVMQVCVFSALAGSGYDNAISKTQKELQDPSQRKALIQTQDAKNADAQIKEVGGAHADEMYALSATALGDVKGQSPEQLMQTIAEAQKDPKAFFQKLPPETQKKIRDLAAKIEAGNKAP